MTLQVVIPMAGIGSRFSSYGFKSNKYLLPINRELELMIQEAILSLGVHHVYPDCIFYFIINESAGVDHELRNILKDICLKYHLTYHIASVEALTEGPASTVNHIANRLDPDSPMIISNSDQVLSWSFPRFMEKCIQPEYAGCLLTYTPDYPLKIGSTDKHSFIKLEGEEVVECAEKIVLSNKAIVGTHYFARAGDFLDGYSYMVEHDMRAPNGEFYISLVYEAMIQQGKRVSYYDLGEGETFYPVGEPSDYFNYLYGPGGYSKEIIGKADSFSWYGDQYECSVDIHTCKSIYEDEATFDSGNRFFVLLSGEAFVSNEDDDQDWVLMEQYMITNRTVKIMYGCKYALIYHIDMINMPMGVWKREDFTRGWFLGNFEPAVFQTKDFEVGLLVHAADEKWDFHYHKVGEETNVLLSGFMYINKQLIPEGSVFQFPTNQIACPEFLTECEILCIKSPSVPGDKFVV